MAPKTTVTKTKEDKAAEKAKRKVRSIDERIADLDARIKSHEEIVEKFKSDRDRLVKQKEDAANKRVQEDLLQQELLNKSPEQLEAELAEAEEAARRLAAIKSALKTKQDTSA